MQLHFLGRCVRLRRACRLARGRPFPPGRLFGVGWSGVDLFFVLSGFLITGILYDARRSRSYFRNFYARRFLRIFPLYYAFLAFSLLILPNFHRLAGPAGVNQLRDSQVWYWTYMGEHRVSDEHFHRTFLSLMANSGRSRVEEQFYWL